MEVSQGQTTATHAVISNQVATQFTIADNPALMDLLSTSAYKNQLLAAIREPLTNAWDSHIKVGKQDTPLSVTVNDTHIIIRDFGEGIHEDRMFHIYTVYGLSLKTTDSTATGGFGVGSKAPFAYTDIFEVISYNSNQKSLYIFSKSSSDNDGKPSGTKVYSIPTNETGLEVRIPYRENDKRVITSYVTALAFLGDIKVTFNSDNTTTELKRHTYSETEPYTFMHHNNGIFSIFSARTKNYVKYGSIVYPIEMQPAYEKQLESLNRLISRDLDIKAHILVFQAEPDSLAIALSRESLSYKASTITTISKLIDKTLLDILLKMKNKLVELFPQFKVEADSFVKLTLENGVTAKKLFSDKGAIHQSYREMLEKVIKYDPFKGNFDLDEVLSNYALIEFLQKNPASDYYKSLNKELVKAPYLDPQAARLFDKTKYQKRHFTGDLNNQFIDRAYAKISKTLSKYLPISNLYTIGSNYSARWDKQKPSYKKVLYRNSLHSNKALHPLTKGSQTGSMAVSWLFQELDLVIASSAKELSEYQLNYNQKRAIVYLVKSTTLAKKTVEVAAVLEAVDKIKKHFKLSVTNLVNLTPPVREPKKATSAPKKVFLGYTSLSNLKTNTDSNITSPGLDLILKPEFVIKADKASNFQRIGIQLIQNHYLGEFEHNFICETYGPKTAVVVTQRQFDSLVNKGVIPLTPEIVMAALRETLKQNNEFIRYFGYDHYRDAMLYSGHENVTHLFSLLTHPQAKEILQHDFSQLCENFNTKLETKYSSTTSLLTKEDVLIFKELFKKQVKTTQDFRKLDKLLTNKYLPFVMLELHHKAKNIYSPEQIKVIQSVLKLRG